MLPCVHTYVPYRVCVVVCRLRDVYDVCDEGNKGIIELLWVGRVELIY
jgi:hypothetical protein